MYAKRRFTFCLLSIPAFLYTPVTSMKFKRVVGGEPLLERDPNSMPYDSVRYFAWFGNSRDTCSHSFWSRLGKRLWDEHCPPIPSDLECGGALIAPFIIQTACHCLSIWNVKDTFEYRKKNIHWLPATVIHFWEDRMDVYLGYNQVDKFDYYAFSLGFYVHQKCAQLTKNLAGTITHDFGWIRLNKPLWDTDYNSPGFYIDYPPLYPEDSLKKLSQDALFTQAFCLVIGFGLNDKNESSNVLKHAWNQILDYESCFGLAFLYRDVADEDITDKESWACARPGLGRMGGRHAPSDSGGPITCNKHYLFLVSLSGFVPNDDEDLPPFQDITWFMLEAALIYAMRENAYEHREPFMNELWQKNPNNPELRILGNHSPRLITTATSSVSSSIPRAGKPDLLGFLFSFAYHIFRN